MPQFRQKTGKVRFNISYKQQNDTLVKSAIINIDQLLQNLEFQRTPSQ